MAVPMTVARPPIAVRPNRDFRHYREQDGPTTVTLRPAAWKRKVLMPRNGWSMTTDPGDDRYVVDAVQRLDREFRGSVPRGVIVTVVRRSHHELDSPCAEALPELVERLARQRLLQHVGRN
jgi:hypothetical protein